MYIASQASRLANIMLAFAMVQLLMCDDKMILYKTLIYIHDHRCTTKSNDVAT